jgi:KUP system potassium uptake protein
VALVIGFRTSSNLAAAYGIAVVGAMLTTSLLLYVIQREHWHWRAWQACAATGVFLALDTLFLAGNAVKVFHGGWFPLAAGAGILVLFTTWRHGSAIIAEKETAAAIGLDDFIASFNPARVARVPGTALFIMQYPEVAPRSLLHHLKHNKVLHEQVILLHVGIEGVPRVPPGRRVEVQPLAKGFVRVTARCGFMQNLDMREILRHTEAAGVKMAGDVTYYIGHMTLRSTGRFPLAQWRKELFTWLFNNERSATTLLGIPPNRVVELGEQTEI